MVLDHHHIDLLFMGVDGGKHQSVAVKMYFTHHMAATLKEEYYSHIKTPPLRF